MRASSTNRQRAFRYVNSSSNNTGGRSSQNPSTTKSVSLTTQFRSSVLVSTDTHDHLRKVGHRVIMIFQQIDSSHWGYLKPVDDDEDCRLPPQISHSKHVMVQPLDNIRNNLNREFTENIDNESYHVPPPICFSKPFMVEPLPFKN